MPTYKTPISRSKTAAMSRVLDAVSHGYVYWTAGYIEPEKAARLLNKLHAQYGIGLTPGQRLARKKRGQVNAQVAVYWPENADRVHWMLLATGPLERETLRLATDKPFPVWMDYELVRRPNRGGVTWTWRRCKEAFDELALVLRSQLASRKLEAAAETLQRIANQPGFHGVREQSKRFFTLATANGIDPAALPPLFFVQKVAHGDPFLLDSTDYPEPVQPTQPQPAKTQRPAVRRPPVSMFK